MDKSNGLLRWLRWLRYPCYTRACACTQCYFCMHCRTILMDMNDISKRIIPCMRCMECVHLKGYHMPPVWYAKVHSYSIRVALMECCSLCAIIDLLEHCSVHRLTRTPHHVPRPAGARRRYEPKSRPPPELQLPSRRHAAAILWRNSLNLLHFAIRSREVANRKRSQEMRREG